MILTRSPFYINIVLSNTFVSSVDFKVEVGNGSFASPAILQTYDLSKPKASPSTTNIYLDISPLIRDVYEFSPMDFTGISAPTVVNSTSLATLVARLTSTQINSLGTVITPTVAKHISTDGYGYYMEGQNLQPTKKILLSHDDYLADSRGYFIVPLRAESGDSQPTVDGTGVTFSYSDNNQNFVKYLVIPMSLYTDTITVSFEGESISVTPVEECRYDINQLQFLNRFGALEVMHFYKTKKDTTQVKRDNFKNAHTDGVSYNTNIHQKKQYNIIGSGSFRLETGFLGEGYNDTVDELMLSENIWMDGTPINITSSSLEKKTKSVDKLISYSLEFEYAFDMINNV